MKIKNMLKEKANKQEINDLQKEILAKVDTSKVLDEPIIAPRRSVKWAPIFAGAFALVAVFALGISIPYMTNGFNNSKDNITNVVETGTGTPKTTEENVTGNNTNTNVIDIDTEANVTIDEMQTYLSKMENQQSYNIINVASSFANLNFDEVTLDDVSKKMTVSEEKALVNDLSSYMYNIEEMLGIKNAPTCNRSKNTNTSYDYNDKIVVSSNDSNYIIYLTEEIISEKNINKVNYKVNSAINGIININDSNYSFVGTYSYKDNVFEYNTKVILDENTYVEVNERFKNKPNDKENIFTYNYYQNNELKKSIIVDQNLNSDYSTKSLKFKNSYTYIGSITVDNENIICKIQSRDGEILTITNDNGGYTYTFKKSNNKY